MFPQYHHHTPERVLTAVNIAFAEGASKVLLFGSSIESPEEANDIDLGIEGIEGTSTLTELGKKIQNAVKKPVDIVDLSMNNDFVHVITTYYKSIYYHPDGSSFPNGNGHKPALKKELEIERDRMKQALQLGVRGRNNLQTMMTMSQACSSLGLKFGLLGISNSVTIVFSAVDNACKRILKRYKVPCSNMCHYYVYWTSERRPISNFHLCFPLMAGILLMN